jgi:hypothetical protein
MKRAICIGLTAAVAVACGGRHDDSTTTASSTPSAQSGSATRPGPNAGSPNDTQQVVSLTGCLQGDRSAGAAVGTSGSAASHPAGSPDNNNVADRFVLASASASASDQPAANPPASGAGPASVPNRAAGSNAGPVSGVGANGAGGSGGSLVSGRSSYALVGNSTDLSAHVGHQVRITGRMSSATTAYENSARTPVTGSPAGVGSASSGRPGSGVGAGASGQNAGTNSPAGTTGPGMRTVTVESVEMVSTACPR